MDFAIVNFLGGNLLMKFLLLLLMLALCSCRETQQRKASLEERQEAIANEIVSIEFKFTEAVFQLNNTNAGGFVEEAKSLADYLHKISNELDTLGPLPADLRNAALKKLNDVEVINKLKQSKKTVVSLKPDIAEITKPAFDRLLSEYTGVMMKAGLVADAKGNPVDINTNGVEPPNHP